MFCRFSLLLCHISEEQLAQHFRNTVGQRWAVCSEGCTEQLQNCSPCFDTSVKHLSLGYVGLQGCNGYHWTVEQQCMMRVSHREWLFRWKLTCSMHYYVIVMKIEEEKNLKPWFLVWATYLRFKALTELPTAGWYRGSAWPSLENDTGLSWDFGGSYYAKIAK